MGASEVRKKLLAKSSSWDRWGDEDLLSTGSTLLNLAISGNWKGGYPKGRYILLVGDSQSGKTFFSLTCLAEAATNPAFDDYNLIYDDVEGGALMDVKKFFGPALADRIRPPRKDTDGESLYSTTVEEAYFLVDTWLDRGPCIYIIDSMDALTSEREQKRFDENKDAHEDGKDYKDDMTDGKAKTNSKMLRGIVHKVRDTKSILLIINQTRDNINAGLFGPKKTRSGGRALDFYSSVTIWTSVGKKLEKQVKAKKRELGVLSMVQVRKNRLTGKDRKLAIPIKYDYGIDDLLSCVDFLIEEEHWKQAGKGKTLDVSADFPEIGSCSRSSLVQKIEELGQETKLRQLVQKVWTGIEEACSEKRKPRYQ